MTLELQPGLTLYLARHGQTKANVEKRYSGSKDTPLTELGRAQARAVGHIMRSESAGALAFVASPFERAQATMRIIRETMGLPPEGYTTDARLTEINLGLWDQLTGKEARALD